MSFSRVARIEIPLPVARGGERDEEGRKGGDGGGGGGRGGGRLLRNKEPPVDELILPDDSRGYGPAGV